VKILVDTNVVLDVLLEREPHSGPACQLFSAIDRGRVDAAICATTVTTVHYLATKAVGGRKAVHLVGDMLELFAVAPVDRQVLSSAARLGAPDYEDAVLQQAAAAWGAAAVVTRDARGFARRTGAPPAVQPDELLSAIAVGPED
jgi:predicted nucleic acid-binding protein